MPVIVYGKPVGCMKCDMTARFLESQGVDYEKRDITAPEYADQLAKFQEAHLTALPIVNWYDEVYTSDFVIDKFTTLIEELKKRGQ